MKKTIIRNLGAIVTGEIKHPLAEGDTVCIDDGRISYIGNESAAPNADYDVEIDAAGLTAMPGVIDANFHAPLSNYLDSYKAYDWVENYAGGGTTSVVSLGAIRFPGQATNRKDAMAQAIAARSIWDNYRPCGAKVHANSVMLQKGMGDEDFHYLRENGIYVVGKVGLSAVQEPAEAAEMISMAHKNGFVVTAHCAAPSDENCAMYTASQLEVMGPDVLCNVNGAPTPLPAQEIKELVQSGRYWFDVVSNGNQAVMVKVAQWALEAGTLDKMMVGTNAPSLSGFSPIGSLIAMIVCGHMTDMKPEEALALGSGNVARCYGLDHGILKVGKPADIVLMDSASAAPGLLGTVKYGRVPAVGTVILDGEIRLERGKNTPPPPHKPVIKKNS